MSDHAKLEPGWIEFEKRMPPPNTRIDVKKAEPNGRITENVSSNDTDYTRGMEYHWWRSCADQSDPPPPENPMLKSVGGWMFYGAQKPLEGRVDIYALDKNEMLYDVHHVRVQDLAMFDVAMWRPAKKGCADQNDPPTVSAEFFPTNGWRSPSKQAFGIRIWDTVDYVFLNDLGFAEVVMNSKRATLPATAVLWRPGNKEA